jgi:hypothetical protein
MDIKKFNKNKPANVKKIENDRVIRYVIKHDWGVTIFAVYVLSVLQVVLGGTCFVSWHAQLLLLILSVLYRQKVGFKSERKQRSDKGKTVVPTEVAEMVGGMVHVKKSHAVFTIAAFPPNSAAVSLAAISRK